MTYFLQVMVGIFFIHLFIYFFFFFFFFFLGGGVQDHNQGPCATWDICQKRILNSNHAKSRLPIYSLFHISAPQSF